MPSRALALAAPLVVAVGLGAAPAENQRGGAAARLGAAAPRVCTADVECGHGACGPLGRCVCAPRFAGPRCRDAVPDFQMSLTITGTLNVGNPARLHIPSGSRPDTVLVWAGNGTAKGPGGKPRIHNLTYQGALPAYGTRVVIPNTQNVFQASVDASEVGKNGCDGGGSPDPEHKSPAGSFLLELDPKSGDNQGGQPLAGRFEVNYDWARPCHGAGPPIRPMSHFNTTTQWDVFGGFYLHCDPGPADPTDCTSQLALTYTISSCTPPNSPTNGSAVVMDKGGKGYNNTIVYSCDDGFKVDGPQHRLCNSTGQWADSEKPTKCNCACSIANSPKPANLNLTHKSNVTHRAPHCMVTIPKSPGNRAHFTPDPGYAIRGNENLTCEGSAGKAVWNATAPECVLACKPFAFDNFTQRGHGVATINSTDQAWVTIKCQDGYRLKGKPHDHSAYWRCNSTTGHYEPAGAADRRHGSADADGIMRFEQPRCEFACHYPKLIDGESDTLDNRLRYRCKPGYIMHDPFFWDLGTDAKSSDHWWHFLEPSAWYRTGEGGWADPRPCITDGFAPHFGGRQHGPVCSSTWLVVGSFAVLLLVATLMVLSAHRSVRVYRARKAAAKAESEPGTTVQSTPAVDSSFMDAMQEGDDKYKHVLDSDTIDFSHVKVLGKVGIGSSAAVFKARMHGTECAVKRLNLMLRNDEERLFKSEVKMLLQLRHPNVVQFYGVSFANDDCYLVTEYCKRGSLYDFLHDKKNDVPYHLQLRMAADAARGLDFLHQKNTIHRDMKSGNLLVTDGHRLKICDFGISRHVNVANTMTASLGTVPWTAPEMLRGERYSKKVDCYSLGVCIWELATRRIPYDGVQSVRIITSVINGMRPQIPSDCSAVLTKLITECWHSKPSMRPSAAAIVERLEAALQEVMGLTGSGPKVGSEGGLQEPLIKPAPGSDPPPDSAGRRNHSA